MSDHSRKEAVVRDLIAEPAEQPWFEFKGSNTDPNLIGKTIAAISNGAALSGKAIGYIIWGVEDALHALIGTAFNPDTETIGNQPLHIWLTQKLSPNPDVHFCRLQIDERPVVLAEVPAASHSPVKFDGVAFVRIGSSTTRLQDHPAVESQLWSKLQSFIWESIAAEEYLSASDVLTALDVKSYFERLDVPIPDNEDAVLNALRAERMIERDVGGRWSILNLGAILIASDLNRFPRLARKRFECCNMRARIN